MLPDGNGNLWRLLQRYTICSDRMLFSFAKRTESNHQRGSWRLKCLPSRQVDLVGLHWPWCASLACLPVKLWTHVGSSVLAGVGTGSCSLPFPCSNSHSYYHDYWCHSHSIPIPKSNSRSLTKKIPASHNEQFECYRFSSSFKIAIYFTAQAQHKDSQFPQEKNGKREFQFPMNTSYQPKFVSLC